MWTTATDSATSEFARGAREASPEDSGYSRKMEGRRSDQVYLFTYTPFKRENLKEHASVESEGRSRGRREVDVDS